MFWLYRGHWHQILANCPMQVFVLNILYHMFSSMGWLNRTAYQCLVMIPKIWNSKLLQFP